MALLEGHMTTWRCSFAIVTVLLTVMIAAPHMAAQVPGGATKPSMTAKLIDAEKKAAARAATVEVTTVGVELVDPALSMEKPVSGQGHLHYQLDKGPIIATPSAKLSFHELTPGPHTIIVMLAGFALGAAFMYAFDPTGGRRRRALVRDQFTRLGHTTSDGLDAAARDFSN